MATTVTIIVVGDEILKGQVMDTNSHMLSSRLYAMGVRVKRIVVVSDEVSAIAEEVRRAGTVSDFVVTCGGIGPTHDDVTYEGVAQALDQPLMHCDEMAKAMRKLLGCRKPGKMAQVPSGSTLLRSSVTNFPVVKVGNVLILPGIPSFCEVAFTAVQEVLAVSSIQFFIQEIRIRADEMTILQALNKTVDHFVDRVTLGSYPFLTDEGRWHTRIMLESTSVDDLCSARHMLLTGLPPNHLDLALTRSDADKVLSLAKGTTPFAKVVANAIKVIEDGFNKYEIADTVVSFNGGKDCTTLLHLLWAVCTVKYQGQTLNTLYVRCADPFPEIKKFIDECVTRYGIALDAVPGPIKPALEDLVARKPNVKAVWMGTRRSDPYSHELQTLQMCDRDWPKLMRINPLLDWTYEHVWTFLRCLSVPYCSLYDHGYTSLGDRSNTAPNPALLDKTTNVYKPAYTLSNAELERRGRT